MTYIDLSHIVETVRRIPLVDSLSDSDLTALVSLTNTHYNWVCESRGRATTELIPIRDRLDKLYKEIVGRIERRDTLRDSSELLRSLSAWIYNREDWTGREEEKIKQFVCYTKRAVEESPQEEIRTLRHEQSIYVYLSKEERQAFEGRVNRLFTRWMNEEHRWGNGWMNCPMRETLQRLQLRLGTTALNITRDFDYEFTDVMEACCKHTDISTLTKEELCLYYDVLVGMEDWYLPLKTDIEELITIIIEELENRIRTVDLQALSCIGDWLKWQEEIQNESISLI